MGSANFVNLYAEISVFLRIFEGSDCEAINDNFNRGRSDASTADKINQSINQ